MQSDPDGERLPNRSAPIAIGMARLAKMAFDGKDLRPMLGEADREAARWHVRRRARGSICR